MFVCEGAGNARGHPFAEMGRSCPDDWGRARRLIILLKALGFSLSRRWSDCLSNYRARNDAVY